MIATTARRQAAEPAQRRDPVAFLLFYRMDWCEAHPGAMFAALGALIVLAGVLDAYFP